ncbi:amidohydrolase family protein [Streptomyces olivochromogenes]|nr:amidohydrolase family protein [Streptomyces olivochromogenes]
MAHCDAVHGSRDDHSGRQGEVDPVQGCRDGTGVDGVHAQRPGGDPGGTGPVDASGVPERARGALVHEREAVVAVAAQDDVGARHRRPTRDVTQPPHGPDQALTAREALQAMTVNAAYAAGEEDHAGRIAVGHRADLTVFADSPLTTTATDLPELPVLLTVLDGRPTHRGAAV